MNLQCSTGLPYIVLYPSEIACVAYRKSSIACLKVILQICVDIQKAENAHIHNNAEEGAGTKRELKCANLPLFHKYMLCN